MRCLGLGLLVMGLLVGCDKPQEPAKPVATEPAKTVVSDQESLQGTWQQVASRINGVDVPAEIFGESRVTFAGDRKSVRFGDQVVGENVLVLLNPATTPRQFEEQVGEGALRQTVNHGIY